MKILDDQLENSIFEHAFLVHMHDPFTHWSAGYEKSTQLVHFDFIRLDKLDERVTTISLQLDAFLVLLPLFQKHNHRYRAVYSKSEWDLYQVIVNDQSFEKWLSTGKPDCTSMFALIGVYSSCNPAVNIHTV